MRILGIIICLIIATAYSFVWPGSRNPERVRRRSPWSNLILRWFHSLAWALLAVACYLRSNIPAGMAGIIYLTFILTLAYERKSAKPVSILPSAD